MENATTHEKICFFAVRASFLLMGIGAIVIILKLFTVLSCSWLIACSPLAIAYAIFTISLLSLSIADKIENKKARRQ